jgi:hypothetical protein
MTMPPLGPAVRATLNYSVDNGIPPDYYFYEPDPAVQLNPPGTDPHEVDIHDGWPQVDRFSLDREGFELHDFIGRFDQFDDDASIHAAFYPQVVDHVRRHTGAKRVVVFDHTIRKRLPADLKVQTEVQRPAVMLVHSDYTVASGPQRVRDILEGKAAADKKGKFIVQAAALASESAAGELAARLKKGGLAPYTERVQTQDGVRWRVRVGPYVTRDDAEKARARLRALDVNATVAGG